jgi:hypothetical protein
MTPESQPEYHNDWKDSPLVDSFTDTDGSTLTVLSSDPLGTLVSLTSYAPPAKPKRCR